MTQPDEKTRVFIFDPCFGGMTGHWENYCKRLYYDLQERNYNVTIFGQSDFKSEIISDVSFVPVFASAPFQLAKSTAELRTLADAFKTDFNRITVSTFKDGDVLIFHSIYPYYFAAIVDWLTMVTAQKKVIIAIFFQFPPSESKYHVGWRRRMYSWFRNMLNGDSSIYRDDIAWLENRHAIFYRRAAEKLDHLHSGSSCELMASCDVLATNFTRLLRHHVSSLPMPGKQLPDDFFEKAVREIGEDPAARNIRVGYFGHSSLDKGGQFITAMVKNTLNKYPASKFVVHVNPNDETKDCFSEVMNMQSDRVLCLSGHLDEAQMMKSIRSVDIVVLPYSQGKYTAMPSATFMEAILLQKVLVIPEDTWMHSEAIKYDAGFVTFKKYTQPCIQDALNQAIENIDQLLPKSFTAGRRYYLENNITYYTDCFLKLLKQPVQSGSDKQYAY